MYERAYSVHRREGQGAAAGRAARTVAWISGNVLGDWAIRSGWVLIIKAFQEPDAQLREPRPLR